MIMIDLFWLLKDKSYMYNDYYTQAASFSAKGLPAAYISADQEDTHVIRGVEEGEYKIVFFTPEMLLLNKKWRKIFTTSHYVQNLRALVLDEAHVMKKW